MMNENHRELISMGLTIGIIAFTLFIVHKFIPSMLLIHYMYAGVLFLERSIIYQHFYLRF